MTPALIDYALALGVGVGCAVYSGLYVTKTAQGMAKGVAAILDPPPSTEVRSLTVGRLTLVFRRLIKCTPRPRPPATTPLSHRYVRLQLRRRHLA